MNIGTHNSATYGNLIWWQRPFYWLNKLTSRCQRKTIRDQWESGVRVFNFQVVYYAGNWHISHGLFTYQLTLLHIIKLLQELAQPDDPAYFTLQLDNNFIFNEDTERFEVLIALIKCKYVSESLVLLYTSRDGVQNTLVEHNNSIKIIGRFWSLQWAKDNAKSLLDWLPLPERHAKRNNATYLNEYARKYSSDITCALMLDFI